MPANMQRRCPHFSVEMETGTGKTYDAINRLLVVATESSDDFARRLQGEYQRDCGVTLGKVPRKGPREAADARGWPGRDITGA